VLVMMSWFRARFGIGPLEASGPSSDAASMETASVNAFVAVIPNSAKCRNCQHRTPAESQPRFDGNPGIQGMLSNFEIHHIELRAQAPAVNCLLLRRIRNHSFQRAAIGEELVVFLSVHGVAGGASSARAAASSLGARSI